MDKMLAVLIGMGFGVAGSLPLWLAMKKVKATDKRGLAQGIGSVVISFVIMCVGVFVIFMTNEYLRIWSAAAMAVTFFVIWVSIAIVARKTRGHM